MINLPPHFIEYILVTFGLLAALSRIVPFFMRFAVILQVAFFILQLYNVYLKNNPESKLNPRHFTASIAKHYLKTNPEGKKIAEKTDVDERLEELCDGPVG